MIRFLFILLSSLTLAFTSIRAEERQMMPPHMTVNGEGFILKPADQIELVVDVMTEDKDPKKAVEENNRLMNRTLENLNRLGLSKDEYQTSRYQLQPVYTIPPKDHKTTEAQAIDHYVVHHTLTIKTQQLNLKNDIVGAVVEGGTNQIISLNFSILNTQSYREEAIALAAQNALENARALALAAKVKITKVLSLSIDQLSDQSKNPIPRMAMAKLEGGANYNPSLQEGPIEIYATVTAILEISTDLEGVL